ncbi:Bax inhibitor-1/YccA family protein [Plantibacter flavus]|uniref:Bax inhibitor-1/YccA family protein n=1 Tax=Plantibacter flavus TaxID=150123 RepID=UPI00237924F5|nr:Bax inhibitor-1/YccA family protein [Plantibacter flavus]MDD9152242.1 Bax inhibitor-1/YccA family protein [Plantibacter flavus]
MALDNPAFSKNPAFAKQGGGTLQAAQAANPSLTAEQLRKMYEQPTAPAGVGTADRMTIENTLVKTLGSFAVLVVFAVISWMWTTSLLQAGSGYALPMIIGMIGGLGLGLVNSFKKEPVPALILGYAVFQGLFVGGISRVFEANPAWSGVVVQAVLATLAVVGVTLALFASGKVRASKKLTKVFLVAIIGYGVFQLLNLVLMFTGVLNNPFGLYGATIFGIPLGIVIGIFAVLMGAYSLVLDFDFIQRGVQNRAPAKYGWAGAFGIMVTVIWIYVEILRLLAISRN